MGGIKNQMMEEQDNLRLATDYLVQIKQLEHCEGHGEVWGGGFFKLEGDFWPKVMGDRKRGNSGPIPWAANMDPREFTDLLTKAYNSNIGDGCGYCARIAARDN